MPWDFTASHRRIMGFAADREWGQFHSPKNLAMALAAEAGELLALFQWLTPTESESKNLRQLHAAQEELADVAIFLILMADRLGIDLETAIETKMASNALRYSIEAARGNSDKIPTGGDHE